jgi:UDP-N-acetylmuramoyl-tripeptide--D-alanyl-D-alanine ligase
MARLSLAEIASAVKGVLIPGARPPEGGIAHQIAGYSIDSRTVHAGDLFFAIVGPRLDGHDFVTQAIAGGAIAVVVAKGGPGRFPEAPALIKVADTTRALQDLGSHVRRARPLKVVGITGSAGKTTAKELAAAVLSERFRTHRSEGNLNNAYGLPLALLRLEADREVAVLEMGMSYHGEITRLVEISDPDVGAILNVLRVHLEHFGSLAEIAKAKGELFRGLRADAVAVYNADDPPTAKLGRAFRGEAIPYGITSGRAEVRAEEITPEEPHGSRFVLRRGPDRVPVHLALPGRHNIYNALAAASIGFALGIDAGAAKRGLEGARPVAMRGRLHRLPEGIQVFDDSYNSNPAAMDGAIEILKAADAAGRRVLVSGDMLELGPYGRRAHVRLGQRVAAAGIDLFVGVGPLSERAVQAARTAGTREARHFADAEAAASFVASAVRPGDLILVKGSRGMRMERVVQALLATGDHESRSQGPS